MCKSSSARDLPHSASSVLAASENTWRRTRGAEHHRSHRRCDATTRNNRCSSSNGSNSHRISIVVPRSSSIAGSSPINNNGEKSCRESHIWSKNASSSSSRSSSASSSSISSSSSFSSEQRRQWTHRNDINLVHLAASQEAACCCGCSLSRRQSSSTTSLSRFSLCVIPSFGVLLLISIVVIVALQTASVNAHWQENIPPRRRIHLRDSDVDVFGGNETSIDYFKYLDRDGDSLLVGARNVVYNISLSTLKENRRLEWSSSEDAIRMCNYKGKSVEFCQNYIKVLAKLADDRVLVCGTHAFKPKCRSYQYGSAHNYLVLSEKNGEALCPNDPSHPSTATFYEKNLYVASVGGFSGNDPLIYREPLRTEQYNPKHLNAPSFVSSFPHASHVYFFFRENAVEHLNCGKAIFSRVARVCARDNGGPHRSPRWTTFSKARLNCSIPGDFPFYFDEIQATSEIVKGTYGGRTEQLVYAVFSTATNSIGGSAICAFRMEDIEAVFRGPFKGQKDIDSNWLPIEPSRVPSPRPGECHNDSQSLPEMTVNFIKEHPLMDHAVPAFWSSPVLVHTSFKMRYTAIAIDPQIETASGKTFDVIFLGTDNGRVIKAINAASSAPAGHQLHNSVVPVVIEEIVVFPNNVPITQLVIHHTYYEAKLVVISPDEIKSIQLHHCKAKSCGQCVNLQDPYCSFDLQQQKCTSSKSRYWNRENYVQNIELGWDPRCPDGRPAITEYNEGENDYTSNTADTTVSQIDSSQNSSPSAVPIYSSETFALAVVTSIVASLVIGFIVGYIFSRRCRRDDPSMCSPYDDPRGFLHPHSTFSNTLSGPGHMAPTQSALYDHYSAIHGAGPHGNMSTLVNTKPTNLVLVAPKSNSKNANSSADTKVIHKVKKIYL